MKDWTISKRITLGFSILALLTLAVGLIGYANLRILKGDTHLLLSDSMPGTIYLSNTEINITEEYGLLERYVRTNDSAARAKIESRIAKDEDENAEMRRLYMAKIERAEDRDYFGSLAGPERKFADARDTLLQLARTSDNSKAANYMDSDFIPAYEAYIKALDGYVDLNSKMSGEIGNSVEKSVKSAANTILIAIIVAFAMTAVISKIIVANTNKVLNHVIDTIDGDSECVAAAAAQSAAASESLAEGASEQAASLEETSSSLEEIASMTASNAASAQQARALADEMHGLAGSSTGQMKEMQQAMDAIKESSAGISEIIKTIDEIAFQTNILALNAAVEAARAGEAGAGFAVVAEEVRNLAQRSAQSAKETSGKIEGAVRNSERGVEISAHVAESLSAIAKKTGEINDVVNSIANASEEQNKGIGQLTTAVQEMDKVTQTTASNAEETASASRELKTDAATLRETINELAGLVRKSGDRTPSTSASAAKIKVSADKTATVTARAKVTHKEGHFLPVGKA